MTSLNDAARGRPFRGVLFCLRLCRPRPSVPRIFDGEKEARLIALVCSKPPAGHARWSLRLLESKVVEFGTLENFGVDQPLEQCLQVAGRQFVDGKKAASIHVILLRMSWRLVLRRLVDRWRRII